MRAEEPLYRIYSDDVAYGQNKEAGEEPWAAQRMGSSEGVTFECRPARPKEADCRCQRRLTVGV